MPIALILGGARSGKSRRAEALALGHCATPVYLATAPDIEGDGEWAERIERHRLERGDQWGVVEAELDLVAALQRLSGGTVLIDCLTLWLSNLLYHGRDLEAESARLLAFLPEFDGHLILVANEVGMGLVPETPEGRAFRDAQGRLNQRLAAMADRVEFVAAGLPLVLKGA